MRYPGFRLSVAALASVTLLGTSVASAVVLDSKSSAFKQRDHIYNQIRTKEVICLAKAARLCEKKDGVLTGQECSLEFGTAPGGGLVSKFAERIAKCESKIDFNKKTPKDSDEAAAYVSMGCPTGPEGGGNYAGVTSWQAGSVAGAKVQIDGLGALIGATHCGGPALGDKDSLKCADKVVNEYIKFANSTMNCIRKCEKDVKDKKGNGGLTDGLVCDARDGAADANFLLCFDKFHGKAVEKLEKADPGNGATHAGSLDLIGAALFDAANPIFNDADDCGSSPSGSFLDAPILY
jgi:hypothetical protein